MKDAFTIFYHPLWKILEFQQELSWFQNVLVEKHLEFLSKIVDSYKSPCIIFQQLIHSESFHVNRSQTRAGTISDLLHDLIFH